MIFVKIFIFLEFSQKQLTFELFLSWKKMSGVRKYVYNNKGNKVLKWLKKELFEKNCKKSSIFVDFWYLLSPQPITIDMVCKA